MPRASYYRKRPGYRAYMDLLWQGLWPSLEPNAPGRDRVEAAARIAPELHPEHRARLLGLLQELGDALRKDAGLPRLPEATPAFFALGAEIPARRLDRASDLFRFTTQPRGRARPPRRARLSRPEQDDVTAWILAAAETGAAKGSLLKLRAAERACMTKLGASRAQVRIAVRQIPPQIRRTRGDRDRPG